MKKVIMIVGSLRQQSFNKQLASEIKTLLQNYADVSSLEYSSIPYLNEDIEYPAPAIVADIRKQINDADGIWIITPEYNYQIPGVLKNLLDWLSRPLIARDYKTGSIVKNKPVTISGAAGKSAAIGARSSLKTLLETMSMKVVSGTGTGVVLDKEAFVSGKLTLSEEVLEALQKQVDEFVQAL